MIIRKLEEISGTERDIAWGNGQSRRFLIARDGMGFSVTDTLVKAGSSSLLEYKNHLEACYCVEGEGEVVDYTTQKTHAITPGTIYALDKHEKHVLNAKTDLRLVCVFNPPLNGSEKHRLNGDDSSSY
ncbi:MAG: ectoine synthase [Gammaproteobacteria bacterium]|nr:ectoine synthase [Gammaproteobacteria bacterium]